MMFLALLGSTAAPVPAHPPHCVPDYEQLLQLSQQAFDQDLRGGWRAVSARDGCIPAAADLIRDYRERHRLSDSILFWHEGQLRASNGQTDAAIALFERSRKEPADAFGWNQYGAIVPHCWRRGRRWPAFHGLPVSRLGTRKAAPSTSPGR